MPEDFRNNGGVLDLYTDDAHIDALFPGKKYTRDKFCFRPSGHSPVRIQTDVDIDTLGLTQLMRGGK